MLCPHCKTELKNNATFCPHCGSDKSTGWADGAEFSNEELPDYDEIIENEFGKKKINPINIIIAIIIVIAFIIGMVL